MVQATATEIQNNFGHYLRIVMSGGEVVVTRNGKIVGRFIPQEKAAASIADSLLGIVPKDFNFEEEREEVMNEKYEIAD